MNYPHRRTTTLFLAIPGRFFRKKVIQLQIPQGSIGEIDMVKRLDENAMNIWLFQSLKKWGMQKCDIAKVFRYGQKEIIRILEKTFFASHYTSLFPESVAELAEKEEFRYNPPESVIFGVVAKNFGISPHELLGYTYDEMLYLMDALRYIHLNDEQKAELQRLENVKDFQDNKEEYERRFAELEK